MHVHVFSMCCTVVYYKPLKRLSMFNFRHFPGKTEAHWSEGEEVHPCTEEEGVFDDGPPV